MEREAAIPFAQLGRKIYHLLDVAHCPLALLLIVRTVLQPMVSLCEQGGGKQEIHSLICKVVRHCACYRTTKHQPIPSQHTKHQRSEPDVPLVPTPRPFPIPQLRASTPGQDLTTDLRCISEFSASEGALQKVVDAHGSASGINEESLKRLVAGLSSTNVIIDPSITQVKEALSSTKERSTKERKSKSKKAPAFKRVVVLHSDGQDLLNGLSRGCVKNEGKEAGEVKTSVLTMMGSESSSIKDHRKASESPSERGASVAIMAQTQTQVSRSLKVDPI